MRIIHFVFFFLLFDNWRFALNVGEHFNWLLFIHEWEHFVCSRTNSKSESINVGWFSCRRYSRRKSLRSNDEHSFVQLIQSDKCNFVFDWENKQSDRCVDWQVFSFEIRSVVDNDTILSSPFRGMLTEYCRISLNNRLEV